MHERRTTWYEHETKLTHAVTVSGVDPVESEGLVARDIRTDCGITLTSIELGDERPVTCHLCNDREWFNSALAPLATNSVVEGAPSR